MLTIEEFVNTGFAWGGPKSVHSQKSYRNHITQFEKFLESRGKTATDGTVNEGDIVEYIAHLKAKYAPNTVAVKVASVKSYFKWLKKSGKLVHSPTIKSQKSVIPVKVHVDDSYIDAIMHSLNDNTAKSKRDLAMLSLIAHCGFKTEKVTAINNEDMDFDKKTIAGHCFQESFDHVAAYAALKTSGDVEFKPTPEELSSTKPIQVPFFLNKHGRRISARSFRRHLGFYRAKVGAPKFTTRDLRHTWLRKQVQKKYHPETVTV